MTRPFLALAIVLATTPALAQPAGSMGTGTSSGDSTGLRISVPNAVREQGSGSSMNAPANQGGTAYGSTGPGLGNTTGAQTSLPSAVQNQMPDGSPPKR